MLARAAALLSLTLHARAQIRVMAPESLVKSLGRVDGATSTFGAPSYGDRFIGRLVWVDSPKHHCKDEDYALPREEKSSQTTVKTRLSLIVMVRRGNCSLATKVRVARGKGADAVVVVDAEGSKLNSDDIRREVVEDEGDGSDINIPSLLISRAEGEQLIEAAKQAESVQVIVELAWDMSANDIVRLDHWTSSASREGQRFLQEFSPLRRALDGHLLFVPHYTVFGMEAAKNASELCEDQNAKYCAEDPDGAGRITGRMVLEEDVRQLCIRENSAAGGGDTGQQHSTGFWDYVEAFPTSCPLDAEAEPRFGRPCAEALLNKLGLDAKLIGECVNNSWHEKLEQQQRVRGWSSGALRINGWRYRGTLDLDSLKRAICTAFTQQPDVCKSLKEPTRPLEREKPEQGGVSFLTFAMALLIVSLAVLGALAVYKRSLTRHIHSELREEVMLEVQAQMDSYKQLS